MARRLAADGHEVAVITTNAREARDFWRPAGSQSRALATREMMDQVSVERSSLFYPQPSPYVFGILRRMGVLLQLARVPSALAKPVQRKIAHWMPPLHGFSQAAYSKASQVDLIQAVDASWDGLLMASAAAAEAHGKPLVVVPFMHTGTPTIRAHYQMAHQVEVYHKARVVVALSEGEAAAYQALGVPSERVHVIPMGIELVAELPKPSEVQSFREKHGLGDHVVAFVGANTADKGALTLVEAILRLNQEGTPVDAVFIGPNAQDFLGKLRSQFAEDSMITERVRIWGVVDDSTKHLLLECCDLVALPSQVETFGMVFLEAWQHGKPVVGCNVGGIPELVSDEETGLLVPYGDVSALAAAIRRLLVTPELAQRIGNAGRTKLPQYSWDRTYRQLLEIYEGALSGPL